MLKQGLKKITQGSIHTQIVKVLKAYQLTPYSMNIHDHVLEKFCEPQVRVLILCTV